MNEARNGLWLERAVFEFVNENHGARVLSTTGRTAVIATGGLTQRQIRGHLIAIVCTVGLWLPVYLMVALLRRPQIWELSIGAANQSSYELVSRKVASTSNYEVVVKEIT